MTFVAPFQSRSAFSPSQPYKLLPVRFGLLRDNQYLVTNDVGEYTILSRDELAAYVSKALDPQSRAYRDLKSRHMLFSDDSRSALDLLALKVRTRAERIANFTGLHIFVVTLRCDHSCHYCQVSRQTEDKAQFDMSRAHAEKAIEHVFRSPSPTIKIEFQGGEPLLNFELIKHIVRVAEATNERHNRSLAFVIASNLSRLDDGVLAFCKDHHVSFSTSLDGPQELHDEHRRVRGGSSYAMTVDGIRRAQAQLGKNAVAALMTTTPSSLEHVEKIVDEYVSLGFHSIFLRSLSPYGFAVRTNLLRRSRVEEWLTFYQRGLAQVLRINAGGYPLREEFTAILLQKMLSTAGTTFVDLQSPAGIGIGGVVYNYDGAVYASDEGRMLAEMGDERFRLGHVDTHTYDEMMLSDSLTGTLEDTMLEGVPMCTDCPFMPFCGADPVYHQATQHDVVGHKAFSDFCKKQMGVLRHVIALMEDDEGARKIMHGWV